MGVAGLWDILRPAGMKRSLTHLAVVDGFEKNTDGIRGYRVGIDASIWFFHAAYGKEGENPELRTLFFRCKTLMRAPFLPLFVFDGPKRPSVKRGKRISGNAHWLTTGMKNIIEAYGFEWRTAPGEAEAELAYLNRIGVIDGILSDDVDTFLFGATVVFRNSSNTLTSNRANPIKNSDGRDDKNHTIVYRLEDISGNPGIKLTRGGLVLIGLLSGGDYHQAGLPGCGIKTAHGLAKCGFGDSLYQAALTHTHQELPAFLKGWRESILRELRTNSQRHLGRKHVALAKSVPENFPDIDILLSYTHPITSETEGRARNQLTITWDKEPDLARLANICELYFEWGVKPIILKRFRTVIWPSAILRILRRAVLDDDHSNKNTAPSTPKKRTKEKVPGSPSKALMNRFSTMQLDVPLSDEEDDTCLFVKIHSSRTHASTDEILEYRLEIDPRRLVRLCEAGIAGIRPPIKEDDWVDDDDDDKEKDEKAPANLFQPLRVWMPASMVRIAEPELVAKFESAKEKRAAKKAAGAKNKKSTSRATTRSSAAADSEDTQGQCAPKIATVKGKPKVTRKKSDSCKQRVTSREESSSCERNTSPYPIPAVGSNIKGFFPVSKGTNPRTQATGKKTTKYKEASRHDTVKLDSRVQTTIELSETDESLPPDSPIALPARIISKSTMLLRSSSDSDTYLPANPVKDGQPSSNPKPIAATKSRVTKSPVQRTHSLVKHSRRKSQATSEESDSYQNLLRKSPRKSSHHSSPRTNGYLSTESGDENTRARSVSPSPLRIRTRKIRESVIEISSDSDDLLTALKAQPLLIARARKADGQLRGSLKPPEGRANVKERLPQAPSGLGDTIDLS